MATSIPIANNGLRNSIRVRQEDAVMDPQSGKPTGKWKPVPTAAIVKPHETVDAWVGPGRRIVIDELPT